MPQENSNDELMPWAEIGRRLRMPVSEVRRMHDEALAKLKDALEEQGVSADDVRAYLRHTDAQTPGRERLIQYLNLYHPEAIDPSGV